MAQTSLTGKRILFMLVDGFQTDWYNALKDCLFNRGALIHTASFDAGDRMTSADGGVTLTSDYSFAQAGEEVIDAVILADNVTAKAVKAHPAALQLITTSWQRGSAVVAIDAGVLAIIGAGIADNFPLATSAMYREAVSQAGGEAANLPIAISENLFTARPEADLTVLCDAVTNFLLRGTEYEQDRWVA